MTYEKWTDAEIAEYYEMLASRDITDFRARVVVETLADIDESEFDAAIARHKAKMVEPEYQEGDLIWVNCSGYAKRKPGLIESVAVDGATGIVSCVIRLPGSDRIIFVDQRTLEPREETKDKAPVFNLGDRVRVKNVGEGILMEINADGTYEIRLDRGPNLCGNFRPEALTNLTTLAEPPEKKPKFKVGDRVEDVEPPRNHATVIEIMEFLHPTDTPCYSVWFDGSGASVVLPEDLLALIPRVTKPAPAPKDIETDRAFKTGDRVTYDRSQGTVTEAQPFSKKYGAFSYLVWFDGAVRSVPFLEHHLTLIQESQRS